MWTEANGAWLSRAAGVAVALLAVLAPPSTSAQSAAPPIDGSNPIKFQASVARLQNELARGDREELEVALAAIWVRNTVPSGDTDRDGDLDLDDVARLEEDVFDLLDEIRRGDLLAAVEKRAEQGGDYTVVDYLLELDGLGFEGVLRLAGRPGSRLYEDALRRFRTEGSCVWAKPTRGHLGCQPPKSSTGLVSVGTGKALAEAIQALSAQKYAEAGAAVGRLDLDKLSPYERSKVEQILFNVAYAEGDYSEARAHLVAAIDAGGLNEQETADALGWIRAIDSRVPRAAP